MNFVDAPHLRRFSVGAPRVTRAACARFNDYVSGLPWIGTSLDWRRIEPECELPLDGLDGEAIWDALKTTALCRETPLLVPIFAVGEPSFAVSTRDAIISIDEIFWKAPGVRLMCAAAMRNGEIALTVSAFLSHSDARIVVAKT